MRVLGEEPITRTPHEVTGILNFCEDTLVAADEIGLSEVTAHDLGLPAGGTCPCHHCPSPAQRRSRPCQAGGTAARSVRLRGDPLADVVQHRYSKVELSMFVLACALKTLDLDESVAYTQAMIAAGTQLDFGLGPSPTNTVSVGSGIAPPRSSSRSLVALGVCIPKPPSRAITSPAGTAEHHGRASGGGAAADSSDRLVQTTGAASPGVER